MARKLKNRLNNLFLMPEIPEKYNNCPPDLVWAIPLAMAQETPEARAEFERLNEESKTRVKARFRAKFKSSLKVIG